MMLQTISLQVNGKPVTAEAEPRTHLADFLRDGELLTGTHIGCEHGVCGACTLYVDGRPVRSCLTLAVSCEGADIRTVEGFEDDALMARIRDAFTRLHGLQCGYCTPGMLATAYDIVRRLPDADDARIRRELSGNLCRCTGYAGIVAAIRDVLDNQPPQAPVQPMQRAAPDWREAPQTTATVTANTPTKAGESPLPGMADLQDGIRLTREIALDASPAAIWPILSDVRAIAACVPGANVEELTPDGVVTGRVTVAIGPMKASFQGKARIDLDGASQSGRVLGRGRDGLSRSIAEGGLDFSLNPSESGGSILHLAMIYRLKGPLAQFGRPALVEEIADAILAETAARLTARAKGEEIAGGNPETLNGLALLARTIRACFARLFHGR